MQHCFVRNAPLLQSLKTELDVGKKININKAQVKSFFRVQPQAEVYMSTRLSRKRKKSEQICKAEVNQSPGLKSVKDLWSVIIPVH